MSQFFINRPIVAMVIAILTVIVGAVTITSLPTAQFPNIAPPEVQVQATYVGADALTLEQAVATPIEQQMSGVDNMDSMYSLNATANGQMTTIVNFDVKTDPNTDLILTQMRETQAASQLPADVTNYGVTVQKSVTSPLMVISLYSPHGMSVNSRISIWKRPGVAGVKYCGWWKRRAPSGYCSAPMPRWTARITIAVIPRILQAKKPIMRDSFRSFAR